MKKLYVLILAAAALCACGQSKSSQSEEENVNVVANSAISPVTVTLANGYAKIPGTLENLEDSRTFTIDVKTGQKLTAKIVPTENADAPANIRFTLVISPDGTTDGPFGRDLTYDITQDGVWRLVVGESGMVGEPWYGNFTVEFTLE